MKRAMVAALGACTAFATQALAAPCAGDSGFADVDAASPFCTNIQWMRNRGVTLGCDDAGTLFCPGHAVTREQMAAFMSRLAAALVPKATGTFQSFENVGLANGAHVCVSAPFPPHYLRQATVTATIDFELTPPAPGLDVRAVYSYDGGATWQATTPVPQFINANASGRGDGAVISGRFFVDAGALLTTGLHVTRPSTATPDILRGSCVNRTEVWGTD
jgi:hypothetical protein